MLYLDKVTNEPKQKHTVTLEDGIEFDLRISFSEQQRGWFADITYGEKQINGIRLANHPNILRQFKNIIPFGLAVSVDESGEPKLLEDFLTQRARIFALDSTDVEDLEGLLG